MSHLKFLVVVLALSFVFVRAEGFGTVAGHWTVTFETPQGSSTIDVVISQDGERLTGELTSPMGSVPLTGTVSDTTVKLSGTADVQGQKLDLRMAAAVDGDTMAGTVSVGDFGEFPFTGKRSVQAAPHETAPPGQTADAAPAGDNDVTGAWNIKLNLAGLEVPIAATLEQHGTAVSGTLKSQVGETVVSGTMTGSALTLQFTARMPLGDVPITMTGTLGVDGFVGKASIAGLSAEAEWTGKRAN